MNTTDRNAMQWSTKMTELYDALDRGTLPLEKAEQLANICGKALKAIALDHAIKVYSEKGRSSSKATANA